MGFERSGAFQKPVLNITTILINSDDQKSDYVQTSELQPQVTLRIIPRTFQAKPAKTPAESACFFQLWTFTDVSVQSFFLFSMTNTSVSSTFDLGTFVNTSFRDKLSALGAINEARGTEVYTALAGELEEFQSQAVRGGLTCEMLLGLSSVETKSRVELLSLYRQEGAKAASGLRLFAALNEYAEIMAAMYDGLEGRPSFVALPIVADGGRLKCGEARSANEAEELLEEVPLSPDEARAARQKAVRLMFTKQNAIRTMERKIAEEEAAKSATAAQPDALDETLAALTKRYDALKGPSEKTHASKEEKPRSAAVVDVLERSAGALGLTDNHVGSIAQLLGKPVSTERAGGCAITAAA